LKLNVGAIPCDVVLKRLFVVEPASALVEVRKLGVLANHNASARGFDLSKDTPQECRLPGSIGTDDADAFASLQDEAQRTYELTPAELEVEVLGFEDGATEPFLLKLEARDAFDLRPLRIAERDRSVDPGFGF
jgi:hypothetical protein